MADGLERRAFEFRASDDGVLQGIVIPYNQAATIGDFSEKFLPGSVQFSDVIANRQHDRSKPLARTGMAGGLSLTDGPDALRARIELPDTQDGRDVRALVKRRVLRGLSAEFRVQRDMWEGRSRTIHAATLTGLAIVDKPGYGGATVAEVRAAVARLEAGCLKAKPGAPLLWPSL